MRGELLLSSIGLLAAPACVGCDAGYLGAVAPHGNQSRRRDSARRGWRNRAMPADDLSLRPANRGRAAGNSLARSGLIAAISWLVLACIAAGSGCVPASSAKTSDEANLVGTARLAVCDVETGQLISSNRIELGQVERGSKTDSTLVLRNSGPASVTIDAWETSCDCLKMPNVPLEIQPGKACQFSFALDLADEHEFRGGLLIAVAGKSRGETLLQMEVDVQVSDQ